MTQYVLRSYCFGYNDENFYICGSRIKDVFDQRDAAEDAYRKAQLGYLREVDLGEHEKFFNGDEAYVRKMAAFIEERTGTNVLTEEGWIDLGTDAHTEMQDDDLFEFGETGELHGYKLIAFDDEPVFHALWNPAEDKYFRNIDEGYEGLLYGVSHDDVLRLLEEQESYVDWENLERPGSLDELSDNPGLLRQFIEATDEITYDDSDNVLRFGYPEPKDVVALNALLRQPIFDVRELSLDEVREIERDTGMHYAGESADFKINTGCAAHILNLLAWILVPVVLIAGARCWFGTCESFWGTLGNTAFMAFKWIGLLAVGVILTIWGLVKLGGLLRKRKGG